MSPNPSVPPGPLGLAAWWLLGMVSFIPATAAAAGAGALLTGQSLTDFMRGDGQLAVIAYSFVHWTVVGVVGAVELGEPQDPTRRGLLDRIRLHPVDARPLLATCVSVVGIAFCLHALMGYLDLRDVGALGELRAHLRSTDQARWLLWAVTLTFAPAFGEEIFFRGFLMHGLDASGPRTLAILGSSLLFSLTHLDPVQMAVTFPVGMFIGWAVLRTGSLWTGIVAHALNNALASLLFAMEHADPGTGWAHPDPGTGWAQLPSTFLGFVFGVPLMLLGIGWLSRRPQSQKSVW